MADDAGERRVLTTDEAKPRRWPWQAKGQDDAEQSEHIKVPGWLGLLGVVLVALVGAIKPFLGEGRVADTGREAGGGTAAGHFPGAIAQGYWYEIISLFFGELGVALLLAYIIGRVIDEQARRQEQRNRSRVHAEAERRREAEQLEALEREQKMVQDVFRGVLGIRHSSAYVRKVIETTLERKVVRRSVSLIYTLRRLNEAERGRIEDADRFMILDQAISFELQNLSAEEAPVDVRVVVPIRQGKNIRDESKLQAVTIGKPLLPEEIIETDPGGDSKCYLWQRTIPGSGKLPVSLKQRLIKEESDTEVWCSSYACTEGMTLQVVAPGDLLMGIRNNTASKCRMETDPCDNGIGVWKIEGPILPNDSVVFYWRTRVDEGIARGDPARRGTATDQQNDLPTASGGEHTSAGND